MSIFFHGRIHISLYKQTPIENLMFINTEQIITKIYIPNLKSIKLAKKQ